MPRSWRIVIASPPDRQLLVAEIFLDDVQLAEINEESGPLQIEVYAHPEGRNWDVPLDELTAALQEAANKLRAYKQRETVN